jgi:isoquinoline 1-oxidoreductase subunit beta
VLTGQYRGPGYNSHCFFVEAFIDECAARARIDPLDYRLRIFAKWADAGWTNCLKEVALRSGWGRKLPAGQGQGVAIGNFGGDGGKPHTGTTVAAVATVEVDAAGALVVQSIDVAFDCGRTLNLDQVMAQLEGSVVFGLNMCLNEELNLENGRIVEGNFDAYPMLRTSDTPRQIRIHTGALSGYDRYTGVGEPVVGVIGPAVANAVFAATGRRLRTMPFRKLELRAAEAGAKSAGAAAVS